MSLCVCGHWSQDHQQFDGGEACRDCSCDRYRKAADSIESTAILSAGGSPEGLAQETVSPSVNEDFQRFLHPKEGRTRRGPMTDEARAGEPRTRCRFSGGLDGITNCATHGWSGGREQVRSVRVCPEAAAAPALDVPVSAIGEVLAYTVKEVQHGVYLCVICETDVSTAPFAHDAECEAEPVRKWLARPVVASFIAAAVAAPALDVERLAEAIVAARLVAPILTVDDVRGMADDLQREYARLSQPSPDDSNG